MTGCAWVLILTEPDELFNWFASWVQRQTNNPIVHKLTYECEKCISGQIALWTSVVHIVYFKNFVSLLLLIPVVCTTILLAGFIKKLWES